LLNYKPLKGRQCRPFLLDNTVVDRKPDGDVHREGNGKRHGPVAEAFSLFIQNNKSSITETHFSWLQSS
jgi:hypothetical protein